MVGTLTASPVCSLLSSWARPTTRAPRMDVQMGSCGALQPQIIKQTRSTLFVLKRMVRLRNIRVNWDFAKKIDAVVQSFSFFIRNIMTARMIAWGQIRAVH